jgi:hypothetical protein
MGEKDTLMSKKGIGHNVNNYGEKKGHRLYGVGRQSEYKVSMCRCYEGVWVQS